MIEDCYKKYMYIFTRSKHAENNLSDFVRRNHCRKQHEIVVLIGQVRVIKVFKLESIDFVSKMASNMFGILVVLLDTAVSLARKNPKNNKIRRGFGERFNTLLFYIIKQDYFHYIFLSSWIKVSTKSVISKTKLLA